MVCVEGFGRCALLREGHRRKKGLLGIAFPPFRIIRLRSFGSTVG